MRKEAYLVLGLLITLSFACYFEVEPFRSIITWHTKRKVARTEEIKSLNYEVYDRTKGEHSALTIDFLKGQHFWYPQIAIWLEDSSGNYLETIFITHSTAYGHFYSGRTAENYKLFDSRNKISSKDLQNVNALPYWNSKKKNKDKRNFNERSEKLDAISGATPTNSFRIFSASDSIFLEHTRFKLMMEINVAFDENEFYSEYDFLNDKEYHGGTGLLGQPSLIYQAVIGKYDGINYYFMNLVGHGHHSGKTGILYKDLSGITTAAEIVERVVVGIKF